MIATEADMKKTILIGTITCVALSVSAQRFIPRIGASLYKASVHSKYPEYDEVLPTVGFTAGVGYEISLTDKISLQPEINFIQKGFNYKHEHYDQGEDAYELNKFTLTVTYLEVPLLIKVQLNKFYLVGGPSIGFGIGGKLKQEYDFNDVSTDLGFTKTYDVKFEDVPEGYASDSNTYEYVNNRTDIGLQVGAGIEIFNKLMIEFRYGLGLTRLYDMRDDIYQFDHANQAKNHVLQLTVGMPIGLRK